MLAECHPRLKTLITDGNRKLLKPSDRVEALKNNPFEKRSNLKQKHGVIGWKVKGEKRNVAAARSRVRVSLC